MVYMALGGPLWQGRSLSALGLGRGVGRVYKPRRRSWAGGTRREKLGDKRGGCVRGAGKRQEEGLVSRKVEFQNSVQQIFGRPDAKPSAVYCIYVGRDSS